jgi:Inner membrane component of T3SS, cytoplasmic domain
MDSQPDGSGTVKLAVVDILDRDDKARTTVAVWQWPVSVGRSVQCDIVLDDEHVAPEHAVIEEADGRLRLTLGDTVNGARLGRRRLGRNDVADLQPGATFEIGSTRLRVRRALDAVAPERPIVAEPTAMWVPLPLLVALYIAWNSASRWVNSDPDGRFLDYLPILVGAPLGIVAWCACWAFASKLFRHRAVFPQHAHVAFGYSLIAALPGLLLPLAAFATGWPLLSRIAPIVTAAIVCAMITEHARLVAPARRRVFRFGMAALFVVGVGLFLMRNQQTQERLFGELYVPTLAPPALRLAGTVAPQRFVNESQRLKATLDTHRKDESGDDSDEF